MTSMHIVFIITRADAVGGATVHVRDMARYVLDRGGRATVLIGGTGPVAEDLSEHGVPYRTIRSLARSIRPWRDARALAEIVSALRDLQPDLVSTHTAKAGWLGRIAARIAGVPALFTPHGWAIADRISPASGRVFRVAERLAAPFAQTIVNVCEAEKRLAERHRIAPASKLAVVHNGVRDIPRALRADPSTQPPRLAMTARFERPKDHAVLLAALAKLRDLDWETELIGDGPLQAATEARAREIGLDGRIRFTGSSSNVAARLRDAQIFVLTSTSEGFPRSILEAMRAGLPVVATDVGGISEAVEHGRCGYLVSRNNERALAEALANLIANPDLRVELGRAARRRYEERFTFEEMARKTYGLYEHALHRPAPAEEPLGTAAAGGC
jgi:glycosyltransferase involved in cell wall biosynthesis